MTVSFAQGGSGYAELAARDPELAERVRFGEPWRALASGDPIDPDDFARLLEAWRSSHPEWR